MTKSELAQLVADFGGGKLTKFEKSEKFKKWVLSATYQLPIGSASTSTVVTVASTRTEVIKLHRDYVEVLRFASILKSQGGPHLEIWLQGAAHSSIFQAATNYLNGLLNSVKVPKNATAK